MKDLTPIPVGRILQTAFENRIVIPAYNVAHLPMLEAIVRALVETDCFSLIEVSRPDVEKFGAQSFEAVAEEYRRCADRSVTRLHLDHVPVVDEEGRRIDWRSLIELGLEQGYDSVMIDGSRLPLEENIAVTAEVVQLAHAQGRPVEAELGAVLGHEPGPLPPYEELFRTGRGFTDPEEAARFVRSTGVDWLSVACGNIHGAISGADRDKEKVQARINCEHLVKLREAAGNIPLVLHGGSGIKRESVLAAIREGITKINIGTQIRQAYERTLRETGDVKKAQDATAAEVVALTKDYFGIEGSAGVLAAKCAAGG